VRVGIVGTGAIAQKHAIVYRNLGFPIVACTNTTVAKGQEFAKANGAEFVETVEELCAHPQVEFLDVCTLPHYRLRVVELCASSKKHVLVEKPMAIDLATAKQMNLLAERAGIQLGVVSQHRFDDSVLFLREAIVQGRLGRILQADAYVKWYRTDEYYSRPFKGSWAGEGGGALINQAIHQLDFLLYMLGPVAEVSANWQLGGAHKIESDDIVNALLKYASGATGVIQASTAIWPGYPERLEIHGTKGTAIITGDKLTSWDVQGDSGVDAPIATQRNSGASDPMAISVVPFERQFNDFAVACREGSKPSCSGEDGYRALQLVRSIYVSCTEERPVVVDEVPGVEV
jgi:UDP-N-acetyl-2-amino-2-deoxyglucuronate dehydrogenase